MLSKIRESDPPERGPFGSRSGLLHPAVPELSAPGQNCTSQYPRPFLREPSKPIELLALCQTSFSISFCGRPTTPLEWVRDRNRSNGTFCKPFRIGIFRAAQNFQTATSIARATGARGRILPGLAMACSLKEFLQGSRGIKPTSPDPKNQLPTSHSGQAQRPPGGSIASMQLSKNSTSYLCLQPALASCLWRRVAAF
jgi:hypothetical protein